MRDGGMAALAAAVARGAAPHLAHLDVGRNSITTTGMLELVSVVAGGKLPRLQQLLLCHNAITADGVETLAKAAADGAFAALRTLDLSGNAIGDSGVTALARAASDDEVLPQLTELYLGGTEVGEKGLDALGEILLPSCGGLPSLKYLVADARHQSHARLKDALTGRTGQRTGHGGVHACKLLVHVNVARHGATPAPSA